MKALINTIVLAAILVAAVIYLETIPKKETKDGAADTVTFDAMRPMVRESDDPPMTVKSAPAVRSTIGGADVVDTNSAALLDTGVELLSLWHVPEAIEVFEALADREPQNLEARLRLVESYAHPTIDAERKAIRALGSARELSSKRGDTLWVDALRLLYIDRRPTDAAGRLIQLVERSPQDVTARRLLCEAYLDAGGTTEAERYLAESLEGDATLSRERELMVRCKVMRGEFKEAEQLARDLATLYPEEPYPYVLLSMVMLITGQVRGGVEFCNNALRLDSRYVPAIVARAQLHVAQGMREAARVNYEKLLLFDDPMLQTVGFEGMAHIDFMSGRFDAGTEGMNEAIRLAMAEGSTRRGLVYALRLVDYLCELGRFDVANGVLSRWVESHGEIPVNIGRIRVLISAGRPREVRAMLDQMLVDSEWLAWMHRLDVDPIQYQALTFISEKRFGRALQHLHVPEAAGLVGNDRMYLRGFALFHNGEAERAVNSFKWARFRLNDVTYPFQGDPVLRVQTIFLLGEAELARGDSDAARGYYDSFLKLWGNADWDLQAVARAREKFEALSPAKDS